MLAYVFWHWPASDVEPAAYERGLAEFHRALARMAPSGFRGSLVLRVEGRAPWLGGTPAYAAWYLVDDSAALDALNTAAVSGAAQAPHDHVAHAASAGVGSLLALRGEQADVAAARQMTWLAKPKGMPYDEFYSAVAAAPGMQQASLWRRQMVLSPTPEFGILSAAPVELAERFQPLRLAVNRLTG